MHIKGKGDIVTKNTLLHVRDRKNWLSTCIVVTVWAYIKLLYNYTIITTLYQSTMIVNFIIYNII